MSKKIIVGIMEEKHPTGLTIRGVHYALTNETSIDCDWMDVMFCKPGSEMKLLVNGDTNEVLGIQVLKVEPAEEEL